MFRRSSINKTEWFRHNWQNRLQTVLLLSLLGGYLYLVGWSIWGSAVAVWILVLVAVLFLLAPAQSPHLIMKLTGARPLNRLQNRELYRLNDDLARAAQLEHSPNLYLLPTRQPNAFAAGSQEEPLIAVSDGLLRLLNRREMAGVLAHEISHLRQDNLRVMRLADLAARLTGSLSLFGQILLLLNLPLVLFSEQSFNWLLVLILILAPQASSLAKLGLFRAWEYSADLGAASLTGDPRGLASALHKIERNTGGFMQRFLGSYRVLPNWLRTHPPTADRVRRLLELTEGGFEAAPEKPPRTAGWQIKPASGKVSIEVLPRPIPIVVYPSLRQSPKVIMREW
ncbi:zinc metalloprotease HtpX [Malonomonas rubra]|uniref:zinc metalloprotease HtpX n=1 Tax=Malonomonas rubra TaxID=57040 RepID=UPI0026EF39CD|nr:zinc metalloprotease HtpX [Malonomonas rubra]